MKILPKLSLVALLFGSLVARTHADDTMFDMDGNTLAPLEQTSISLKKEVLRIEPKQISSESGTPLFWDVNVSFEFFNPGKDCVLQVGFVTPPPSGGGEPESMTKEEILSRAKREFASFKVVANGIPLKYNIIVADDLDLSKFSEKDPPMQKGDVVCLFNMPFKKGLNNVEHSYQFIGSADSMFEEMVLTYRLKTGGLWSGHKIDDFQLTVVGDGHQGFESCCLGEGTHIVGPYKKDARGLIYLKGTFVQKFHDFVPEDDLVLKIHPVREGRLELVLGGKGYCIGCQNLTGVPKDKLRVLRNLPYAWHNYAFKSKDLAKFFAMVPWYFPDPKVKLEDIRLSKYHEDFVNEVREAERSSGMVEENDQ